MVARRIGLWSTEAETPTDLGNLYLLREDIDKACEHFRQALTIFQRGDNQAGQALALAGLGARIQNIKSLRAAERLLCESRRFESRAWTTPS